MATATQYALPLGRIRDEFWDFKDTIASTGVYGIHPYPAMFHFLVVRQLLHEFSKEGDSILDPFMGSGVVATECLLHHRNFIGYDLNPLAVLIAKVRSTPISQRRLLETLDSLESEYSKNPPEPVDFHNLHYWFDDKIIQQLSKLRKSILRIDDGEVTNFFKVVFSEVVRRVSRTEYSEFKLLRRKTDNHHTDVLKVFKDVSRKNIGLLAELDQSLGKNGGRLILENRNFLEAASLDDGSIDLVITSPPYGDSRTTVAYGQFSRLSLRWLGLDENVDRSSLGSKPREITLGLPSGLLYAVVERVAQKDERRAQQVFSFYNDLFEAIQMIERKVKANAYVCFVVGNRRVKGEELPTDKISADFFVSLGFNHHKTIVRAISNKRMPMENSPSNLKGEKDFTMRYEYIVILKKEGRL